MEIPEEKELSTNKGLPKAEASAVEDFAHGIRLATIAASLLLGMFLVALDNVRTIPFLHDATTQLTNVIFRQFSVPRSPRLPMSFTISTKYHGTVHRTS
jgi:hypothetical protein